MSDFVRGRGVVEIFDASTGRLCQCVPFENYVSTNLLTHNKWSARQPFCAGYTGTAGDPEPVYTMTHLAAWDDSSAEVPSATVVRVPLLIAYGTKATFAGSDPRRGSVNTAETVIGAPPLGYRSAVANHKWVFDWPTNSGNGTFQSIGWMLCGDKITPWVPTTLVDTNVAMTTPSGSYWVAADHSADKFYTSGTVAAVVAVREHSWSSPATPTQLFTITAENQIAYDPTGTPGFWLAKNTAAANPCAVKRGVTGTQLTTVPVTWTTIFGSAVLPTHLAFDGTYLWASNGANAYRINPTTGAVITTLGTAQHGLTNIGGMCWSPTRGLTLLRPITSDSTYYYSEWVDWNITSAQVVARWQSNAAPAALSGGTPVFRESNQTMYALVGGVPNLVSWVGGLATRTLLASPVTKLPTQTMKITYQFDFS